MRTRSSGEIRGDPRVATVRKWAPRVGWWVLSALAVYATFLGAMFIVLCQPPQRFGQIMAHFPMPAMRLVPFEPMWNLARAGATRAGEMAPDFSLQTVDRKTQVRLASFRGKQPVVLVFGSYT
jgi:hypothetical protein